MFRTNIVEKIKTNILCTIIFIFENRDVCEIMWKNNVERSRPQITIRRMRIACWIPKATNTLRLCNTHCFSTAIRLPPGYIIRTLPVMFSLKDKCMARNPKQRIRWDLTQATEIERKLNI
jgi:hypothetical protein